MVNDIILNDIQLDSFLKAVDPPLSDNDYELQLQSFQKLKKQRYLFSWVKHPQKHNKTLISFLKQRYNIDWLITANVKKIDDGMAIRVSNEKNHLILKLNSDKTKVNIVIDDGRTEEFTVKTKNNKLNIYSEFFVLPYILNVDHLATCCGISPSQLHLFIANKRKAYSTFKLPKKRGGFRKVDAPSKNMKVVQRWILNNILYKLNAGEYAHGFIPKKSIVTNASVHVGQDLVLCIDLNDFFPSITLNRVMGLFRSVGYTNEMSRILGEICTFNWRLPQGAPTSPMISNLIAWNLDLKLSTFCQDRNLNYSRYADDITISGGKTLPRYKSLIFRKIEEEGFSINWDKVRLHDRGSSQRVTGLVVNDKVNLERKRRKKLRAIVHNIVKNGPKIENRENNPFFKEHIFGKLAFAKMVDPDFANPLINSLKHVDWGISDEDFTDLIEGELVVRSIKKKSDYVPYFESQVINSETDLFNTVFNIINKMKNDLEYRRISDAFWNDKRKVTLNGADHTIPAEPKKEPKIQPTIERFLHLELNRLGIHIVREPDEGIGNLDFKFLFTTKTCIPLLVCSELKLAHNPRLEHGLTKQLPAYLRANDSKFGIFLVMWFKDEGGKVFDKPTKQNKSQMIEFIDEKIIGIKNEDDFNIELILIDVSKKPSASNL